MTIAHGWPSWSRADLLSGESTALRRERNETDSTITMSAPAFGRPPPVPALVADGHRLAVGDRVCKRYRILHFVARGAVGEVYAAHDEELDVTVALKTLRPELANHASTMARFRREVLLTRELVHPGVCRMFDLGVHESGRGRLLFLTMEFIAGETLADRLARTGPLAPAAVHDLAEKLASALAAVHRAGVVHRDLKPANIMLVADPTAAGGERVVITDFGLVRRTIGTAAGSCVGGELAHDPAAGADLAGSSWADDDESATATGTMIGSPAYMAPEQVAGLEVGPAVDIYSLGVVLFEAITGVLPFQGDSPLAMAASRLERDAPSVRTSRPDLHAGWEAALARCLARDPSDRFLRVDDLPRALAVAIAAESPAPGRREGERPRSRPGQTRARRSGGCPSSIAAGARRHLRRSRRARRAWPRQARTQPRSWGGPLLQPVAPTGAAPMRHQARDSRSHRGALASQG